MFSPYYAWARRRGRADPEQFCAVNVALYGPRGKRWSMTERGSSALARSATSLAIGPSVLRWDGEALVIAIDEIAAPVPLPLRGTVRLIPHALADFACSLDGEGAHRWSPIAPRATIEVAMERPALSWRGAGYFDCNQGDVPLEDGFCAWDWSRAHGGGSTAILYHGERRGGGSFGLALEFDGQGRHQMFDPPQHATLPSTMWRVTRATRADAGGSAHVLRTFEDTPFYARSLVSTRLLGRPMIAMHESLSLDRFAQPWVQMLLPFRMPRRLG